MTITSKSTHNRQKRQKAQNSKKTSFRKELVENTGLHNEQNEDHKRIMREV